MTWLALHGWEGEYHRDVLPAKRIVVRLDSIVSFHTKRGESPYTELTCMPGIVYCLQETVAEIEGMIARADSAGIVEASARPA